MAALGWDQGQVYSTAAVPGQVQVNSHSEITSLFYSFIQNYRLNNNFIYRDQLQENVLTKQYFIEVDMLDLIGYNADLANSLKNSPADYLPLVKHEERERKIWI